jgi:ribonuclease HI
MSSTRTELCGVYAALCYTTLVKMFYHLVLPRKGMVCTVFCDSKAALQRIRDLSYSEYGTTWRCRANYDLEAEIRSLLQQQVINVTWEWVRGHAIRRKQRKDFTWAEQLNDKADSLATRARNDDKSLDRVHLPEQQISIEGPRGRVTGRLDHEIRYCCTAPDLLSYWQHRFGWSAGQVKSIDTIGTAAASKGICPEFARRLQKLRCGWLPVNNRESRCDPDRLSGCSACSTINLVPETVDHVFQCPDTQRRRAILDRFTSFYSYLRSLKTAKPLISALQTGAIAWIEGRSIPPVSTLDLPNSRLGNMIATAYIDQTALGWNVLFRGFWVSTWRDAQEVQFSLQRSRELQDTGERWSAKAQTWFFEVFELIWGLRNADEHGANEDTQRLICLAKCERAIRRLYDKGEDLSYAERHPFRDDIEDLLQQPVHAQELWIDKTEAYLRKAFQRARARPRGQPAITQFFTRLHEVVEL